MFFESAQAMGITKLLKDALEEGLRVSNLDKKGKKKALGSIIKRIHFQDRVGCRLAVDASIFINSFVRSTKSHQHWALNFCDFLITVKECGVLLVVIFDGKSPPIEKTLERESRRKTGANQIEKADILQEISRLVRSDCEAVDDLGESYTNLSLLSTETVEKVEGIYTKLMDGGVDVTNTLEDEFGDVVEYTLQERIVNTSIKIAKILFPRSHESVENASKIEEILDFCDEKVRHISIQSAKIVDDDINLAKKICKYIGYPSFTAHGEAEALCAHLNIRGIVDGIITNDTDILPYGNVKMYRNYNHRSGMCEYVSSKTLRRKMLIDIKMDRRLFRELCICLKCDYNKKDPTAKTKTQSSRFYIRKDWDEIILSFSATSTYKIKKSKSSSRDYISFGGKTVVKVFRQLALLKMHLTPELQRQLFDERTIELLNLDRCASLLSSSHISVEDWPHVDYTSPRSSVPRPEKLRKLLINKHVATENEAANKARMIKEAWEVKVSLSEAGSPSREKPSPSPSKRVYKIPIVSKYSSDTMNTITQQDIDEFG